MLLDFYCTLVDLSDPVRSRGFDDFARRLALPLGPGELYRRYTEMITSEPAQDAVPGIEPYRTSWLAAGRRLLAPFGRQSAAGRLSAGFAGLDVVAGRVLGRAAVDLLPDVVKVIALAQGRDYRQPAAWDRGQGTAALSMLSAWCMGMKQPETIL